MYLACERQRGSQVKRQLGREAVEEEEKEGEEVEERARGVEGCISFGTA